MSNLKLITVILSFACIASCNIEYKDVVPKDVDVVIKDSIPEPDPDKPDPKPKPSPDKPEPEPDKPKPGPDKPEPEPKPDPDESDEKPKPDPDESDDENVLTFRFNDRVRNNIQVGEHVKVEIPYISDDNPGEQYSYILKPVGSDQTKHQLLDEDYHMVNSNVNPTNVKQINISTTSSKPTFFLKAKRPGTFNLDFELSKIDKKTGKIVGKTVTKTFLFSAVKITIKNSSEKVSDKKIYLLPFKRMKFQFKIDDGERIYDKYLTDAKNSTEHSYRAFYNGEKLESEFKVNEFFSYYKTVNRKPLKSANFHDYKEKFANITIVQLFSSGIKNIIEYKNINVKNK